MKPNERAPRDARRLRGPRAAVSLAGGTLFEEVFFVAVLFGLAAFLATVFFDAGFEPAFLGSPWPCPP